MSSRDSYYESDEWQEWSDRIHVLAERNDLELTEGTPEQEHAEGLWLGETEPSGAYSVTGTEENIETWASQVAAQYNQDAVMVLHSDKNGPDTMYRFNVGDERKTQDVLDAMKEAEVPGGRIVDGDLEVVSLNDEPVSPEALSLIQQRLGCEEVTHSPVRASFVEKDESKTAHQPIKEIQGIRQRHAEKHGLPVRGRCPHLTDADDIAASMAYENAEHDPEDPTVKRSYATFRRHLGEQYNSLTEAGYSFEPWSGVNDQGEEQEQPYANSAEMMADLRENKRLYYFRTEVSQDTEGALPDDHPMAKEVIVKDKDGNEQKIATNDAFRAVHDSIAHSEGHQFGAHGEKMAWWTHRSSLPREAHLALWNETRAQNVYFNSGPHMRTTGDDGNPRTLRKGEEGWTPAPEREYAEQKCTKVPAALT